MTCMPPRFLMCICMPVLSSSALFSVSVCASMCVSVFLCLCVCMDVLVYWYTYTRTLYAGIRESVHVLCFYLQTADLQAVPRVMPRSAACDASQCRV
jgi:hypothetical protein